MCAMKASTNGVNSWNYIIFYKSRLSSTWNFKLHNFILAEFYIICTVHSVIRYSQTNKCSTITNKVYLTAPTYVSASNLTSSGDTPNKHSYSMHPTTCTFSIVTYVFYCDSDCTRSWISWITVTLWSASWRCQMKCRNILRDCKIYFISNCSAFVGLTIFHMYSFKKSKKTEIITFFKRAPNFFLLE
jgi:hypothetical protein